MRSRSEVTLQLWMESISARGGLERIARSIGVDPEYAPYLYLILLIFVDVPVLSTIGYLTADRSVYVFPFWPIIPVGLLFGLWAAKTLRNRLVATLLELEESGIHIANRLIDRFDSRIKIGVLLAGYALFGASATLYSGFMARFFEFEGPVIGSLKLFIILLGYAPLLVEILALVVGIHVLLPLTIRHTSPALDLGDPRLFGGLYPIGRLLQFSTIAYFAGLLLFSLNTVFQVVFPGPYGPTLLERVLFFGFWIVGVPLYAIPVYIVHRHMKSEKERQLERLNSEQEVLYQNSVTLPQDDRMELYTYYYLRLQHVHSLKEYPTNITILRELTVAALIPLLLQQSLVWVVRGVL